MIVTTYIAWNLVVKPPAVAQEEPPPTTTQPDGSLPPPSGSDTGKVAQPVGLTRRDGVYNFLLVGCDKGGGNTDTIILVSYDIANQKIGVVSVPRDTAVDRTWAKNPKINAAFGHGGIDLLKEEIKHTFGIPIDYYIKVDLKGFVALVDQLGGVDVDIPSNMDYDDPYQDLHIHFTKGKHHLDGQGAMEVVRFRHNNDGSGYNDEGRSQMQQQVLAALAKKVLSWGSIAKINSFIDIFQTYVKTDLSTTDMAYFASQALNFDTSTGLVQGQFEGRGDAYYKGYEWCYVFEMENVLPVVNELLNPYTTDLTRSDLHLVKADRYYFN